MSRRPVFPPTAVSHHTLPFAYAASFFSTASTSLLNPPYATETSPFPPASHYAVITPKYGDRKNYYIGSLAVKRAGEAA
ncbi:hypothetical protein Trydic_g7114 [Trypoxylus dichotomus]